MQANADSPRSTPAAAARGWVHRLLWGRLNRPLALLLILLLGNAAAMGWALTGSPLAGRLALTLALAALAVLALLLYRMRRRLGFVEHLRDWAERMRGGDLSARVPRSAEADLDDIIEDINSLGGMLEKLAFEMDAQLHTRTVRLARKTQSLDTLYEIALSLTRPGNLDQQLESFLDTFIELVGARAATVHLLDESGRAHLIAGRRLEAVAGADGDSLMRRCAHCGWDPAAGGVHILTGAFACARRPSAEWAPGHREVAVVPVRYQDRTLGAYTLYLDWPVSMLGEDALELLTSIGRHLGLAVEKARLDTDARRLAIMEERNAIGHELHDSLAQSLVGMRLRAKMLGEILHKNELRAAQSEVRHLREAIEQAHDSLRELLANFRLKIDERGLVPAIEGLARRFGVETGIAVFFHSECPELVLTPAQEMQVYHIVQEALSNIRKHSHARTARIRIGADGDRYTVLIEDDGYGMLPPGEARPGEHIGLSVMQERAKRLPGELTIESEPGEGTHVLLTFGAGTNVPASRAAGG